MLATSHSSAPRLGGPGPLSHASPEDEIVLQTFSGQDGNRSLDINAVLHSDGRHGNFKAGQPLRRFYLRGIVAILIPPAVATYFVMIWILYLTAEDADGPLRWGRQGSLVVFYSWFIISTIGLNLAKYGLVGVEASMLMEPRWGPQNAVKLMMHNDRTWSGPGGWLAVARKLLMLWRQDRPTQWPSKLWVVLAGISALPYVALPLSGLCMELSDGFIWSDRVRDAAFMIGRNYTNFEERIGNDMIVRATEHWRSATAPVLPGLGIAYVPETADRSLPEWSFLDTLPNTLPVNHGLREIFVGPQADAPVVGTVWGVMLRYNCSVVPHISDFTILNHRNGKRADVALVDGTTDTFIFGRNQSFTGQVYNVQAYMEVGSSSYEGTAISGSWSQRYYDFVQLNGGTGQERYAPPRYDEKAGLDGDEVLEVALWQAIDPDPETTPAVAFTPNSTLDVTIPELGREVQSFNRQNKSLGYMSAIGARCTSNSAVGYATIDGRSFSFHDFRAGTTIPTAPDTDYTAAVRFSSAIPRIILQDTLFEQQPAEWLYGLYTSTGSTRLIATQQARGWMAPRLLQASDLLRSLLQAHASYALQLQYDGRYDLLGAYSNTNATALIAGKVLTSGVVPPAVVAALLVAWAVFSTVLGCWYAFRRRWSETLDGYSLFRFGADYANFILSQPDFGSAIDYETCGALEHIPGMVGNLAPSLTPGHIGLVDGVYAPKGALYA